MKLFWKKLGKWVLSFAFFISLLFIMDSCFQFRMSKKEIGRYFEKKVWKGTLQSYIIHQQKINYLTVGDDHSPLVVFVHGSPGSLSAFIDFMADTPLLEKAQLISVDRPGFGESSFGYAQKSVKKQVWA